MIGHEAPFRRAVGTVAFEHATGEKDIVARGLEFPAQAAIFEIERALDYLRRSRAEDGFEALERWRQGHYSLLLTDLHMPGMDGYELTQRLREAPATMLLPTGISRRVVLCTRSTV